MTAHGRNGARRSERQSPRVWNRAKFQRKARVVETGLPESLAAIKAEFLALNLADRLQLLLELSEQLPDVPPEKLASIEWEQVHECQSPVFIQVDSVENEVTVYAKAPREAPTTRGFASILVQGLTGSSPGEVLEVPADFPLQLGLQDGVSSLRLRGMSGMLRRIKSHV